jgi:hypothetical protein
MWGLEGVVDYNSSPVIGRSRMVHEGQGPAPQRRLSVPPQNAASGEAVMDAQLVVVRMVDWVL